MAGEQPPTTQPGRTRPGKEHLRPRGKGMGKCEEDKVGEDVSLPGYPQPREPFMLHRVDATG